MKTPLAWRSAGWQNAFENLPHRWRPETPEDAWQLDEDGMTLVSINGSELQIARGQRCTATRNRVGVLQAYAVPDGAQKDRQRVVAPQCRW